MNFGSEYSEFFFRRNTVILSVLICSCGNYHILSLYTYYIFNIEFLILKKLKNILEGYFKSSFCFSCNFVCRLIMIGLLIFYFLSHLSKIAISIIFISVNNFLFNSLIFPEYIILDEI